MTIAVVTSCSAKGWDEYGRRFAETYVEHWPQDIPLFLVSEDSTFTPRATFIPLGASEAASEFLQRHAGNERAKGRVRLPTDSGWNEKKIREGYNFRFDAYRFARKVFAIELVAGMVAIGRLFWIDADVVTHATMRRDFLERILPSTRALCCLDRGAYHSECGFVGYNLEHPTCLPFIKAFASLYASDRVFELGQWHDSWVFDWLRRKANVPTHAIPHTSRSQPFEQSELSTFMSHLKGDRKRTDRAPSAQVA